MDTPTFCSFENISIAIGSAAQLLVLTCVYRPPGSCSDSFLDQFLNLLEYLSSVSPSFLICGDFNIDVDTSSNDSIKFQNCLESCNITQNVQKATHLHGHILDLVLTPTDASVKIRQITLETWSEIMLMTPRSYGRSYVLHCTLVLKQYSLLMNLRKVLLTRLSLSLVTK